MPEVLTDRALCTEADVLALLKIDAPTTEETDLATRLVNAASDALANLPGVRGREFAPAVLAETRTFDAEELLVDVDRAAYRRRVAFLPIGDASEVDTVTFHYVDGTSAVLAGSDWAELPRRRKAWEPVTELRLEPASASLGSVVTVDVLGDWGFPELPEDVRQAAILTAASWYGRDVSRFSDTFVQADADAAAPGGDTRAIPRVAYDLMAAFMPGGSVG